MSSEYAKAMGTDEKFTHHGTEYTLSAINPEIQAQFECWLQRNALEALARHKAVLSDQDYKEQRNQLFQDFAAGLYSFNSTIGYKSRANSLEGRKELFRLRIKQCQPNISREDAEEIFGDHMEKPKAAAKSPEKPAE